MSENIERIAARVSRASYVCVLTGAGVSAESGVPTFRGKGGLWKGRQATELATPEAFRRDPDLVWQFYLERRGRLLKCYPNPAHRALAAMESACPGFCLITQNVDGLHRRAGSADPVEIHGDIFLNRCPHCGHREQTMPSNLDSVVPAPPRGEDADGADNLRCLEKPACPSCGTLMRPGVVWFGEALPEDALRRVDEALGLCDVMLVVGTSAVVQPAASFADLAGARGAFVAELNLEPTPLSPRVNISVFGRAGDLLPRLLP